ncbi:MAG: GNAT family N-acetyltransferase, partial [Bacteroidetes bacterium]|nr:GNAT family N-acetyltransferase [Bacteroidota bacterium]
MLRKLETERLTFRDLDQSDLGNLQEIFADPIAMKYYPSTKSESETLEWINWNIASYQKNGYGLWALVSKSTGEFVGQCGLILQRDVDGIDEVEVAYLLVRKHWGNGFATEAAAASRNFAFSNLVCKRVISLIDPK